MEHFPILILIGRPASGKSEIIDYLAHCEPEERLHRFHIAQMDVLDDFPMLWTWFEEDHLLATRLGQPRLHTDEEGYFLYEYQWYLLIERLDLEYLKRLRDPAYAKKTTTIIEFSRGSQHGGYTQAFQHLSEDILSRAAVLYVNVPFEESLRKNRRRFNAERPDSILEHGLPDAKLERLYRDDDWAEFTCSDPHFLTVGRLQVPYAIFENEDDVTTGQPEELAVRLEQVLEHLSKLCRA